MATIADLSITDRNPAQETEYQQLLTQAGIPFTVVGGKTNVQGYGVGGNNAQPLQVGGQTGGGVTDPLALAGSLQQMQVTANQPAIQTLQGQQSSLKDQYSTLLNSVLGQGSAALNTTTAATSAELARRGITNDSYLYGQEMGSALLPVTAQNQAAAANVGLNEGQTLAGLAAQIASLQTGNVPGAISAAPGFAGVPANIALLGSQAYQAGAAGRYIPIPGVGVYDVSKGQLVGGLSQNNLSTGGFQILNVGQ